MEKRRGRRREGERRKKGKRKGRKKEREEEKQPCISLLLFPLYFLFTSSSLPLHFLLSSSIFFFFFLSLNTFKPLMVVSMERSLRFTVNALIWEEIRAKDKYYF